MLESLESRMLLATFFVNSTGDEPDIAPGNGICETAASGGVCTLRAAIQETNALANDPAGTPDEIHFNIAGAGVQTINVGETALPPITDPLVIDGYTQPGSSVNTNTVESRLGLNTVLRIELRGPGDVAQGFSGLVVRAGNSTVRGLVINQFEFGGIVLNQNGGNVIEGNFIGTDASGAVARGISNGVEILSSGNRVGGTTPAARNLISGNPVHGVSIDATNNVATDNVVQGNLIGTDVTGTLAVRNGGAGVSIQSFRINSILASGNTIGGTAVGAGNVISGNNGFGVGISNAGPGNLVQGNFIGTDVTGRVGLSNGSAAGGGGVGVTGSPGTVIGGADADDGLLDGIVRARNVISGSASVTSGVSIGTSPGSRVQGNFIGTDVTGAAPLGNGFLGVLIGFSIGTMIGGTASGAGNVIAFNGSAGVFNDGNNGGLPLPPNMNTGHAILGNSIFANGGKGISLANRDGVTANDPGDADTGSNNLQNFPVLSEVISTAVDPTVFGFLNSTRRTDFLIQFFASATADPSGHGEGQTFLGETVVRTSASGNATFAAALPVRVPQGHHVTATATRLEDPDANPSTPAVPTDTSEFSRAINEAVSVLELDQTITQEIALGQEVRFRLNVPPGTDARLSASFANAQIGEIFVLLGEVPDPNNFGLHAIGFVNPNPEFLLPGSSAPYLILVRGTSTAAVPSGTFTLTAAVVGLEIDNVAPNHGSNAGQATATIVGFGFTPATVFSLVANDGTERPAATIVQQSETTFFATFDLVGLVPGVYDMRAVDGIGSAVADDAFTVTTGSPGQFRAQLVLPGRIRNGLEGVLVVEYGNVGETDIPAPLLIVASNNAVVTTRPPERILSSRSGGGGGGGGTSFVLGPPLLPPPPPPIPPTPILQFLAISEHGPAGVLPPGARGRVEVLRFQDDGSQSPNFHSTLDFLLSVAGPAGRDFDLAASKPDLRPSTVDPEAWDIIFNNLLTRLGTTVGEDVTVGEYVTALDEAANYLSRYGIYTSDIGRLVSLFVQQADAALPGQTLHAAIDAVAPASGLPLVWGRSFAPTISRRFELGILGRGWSHPWDYRLLREPDRSDVLIHTPGGTRRFTEEPDGSFVGTFSDPGQLSFQGDIFTLREPSGTASRFDALTGRLLEVEDRNGNRVTLNYTSGNLTSLVHSNGDQFTLSYNALGRLSQLQDQAGRITTFEYDATGEHLLRVTGPDGTTAYTYDTTDGSPQEHALTSVTRPDATQVFYTYDVQGRLARIARAGGAEAVTFSYGSVGEVFVSDASGATSGLFFNEVGQILETRDPLGRSLRLDYDLDHRSDRLTLPLDTISLFDFDSAGNLTSLVKPDGQSITASYDKAFSVPRVIRDERGILLQYNYDAEGNPTSIVHADGSAERFSFDAAGNVTRTINRRDQAITYTYDARGLLVRKDHADGSFATFTYDDRGNLLTATDERGTTTSGYDEADRLTNVTYPNGRSLQYAYDVGGRRIRMEDHDGFAVNYTYDALGRMERLTDGSGALLVSYSYDAVGRLAREDNGNGTFTTYTYDVAGQLTSLVNHAPDGSVNSRFDYKFDALGRRTSVTTLEGPTTLGYDPLGQLTLVTLPGGRTIQYEYDVAGNRIAVVDGGVRTDYTMNDLNQYTQVGSGARTYDADGNLISEGSGGATYNYDDENRLVGFADASSSVQYEYDSLGNRLAKVEGGVRIEYLPDPTGLVNVVAEYDASGNVVARYVHGFGLVSRHDAAGSVAFYDYDALGSTAALTGSDGSAVNRYSYLPFGEPLTHSETVSNPFEYVGQLGVQRDGNGLDFMRARYYATADGRFISEDPIGISGGLNLYRYVGNQPSNSIDPSGLVDDPLSALFDLIDALDLPLDLVKDAAFEAAFEARQTLNTVSPYATTAIATVVRSAGEIERALPNTALVPLLPVVGAVVYGGAASIPLVIEAALATLPATFILAAPLIAYYGATSASGTFYGDLACDILDCDEPDFDVPAPPGEPEDGDSTRQVASFDPNDITGPAGFGQQQFVPEGTPFLYTIRFENLAAATAPAQTVTVTQQLDPDFDFETFELMSFGLGASTVQIPTERSAFTARFDLDPLNLFLDVSAALNLETGLLTWTFTSLDPATLELPEDPLGGFLPPNQNPPEGEGFVTYLVLPKASLPTGTRIDAQARIVFDINAPIDTPAIFHTIDAGAPASSVDPLLPITNTASFPVTWSGSDDADGPLGSGIGIFDVFVSTDGGPFAPFREGTIQSSATFIGAFGHTYGFYSVATDNVGHRQATPSGAQALTETLQPDTTSPLVTVPQNITAEATGLNGAVVSFSSSAMDDVDGPLATTCTPPSGSTFALATTTVTCSATDAAGNAGSSSFNVTVEDTTTPVVTVPANITAEATGPSGAVVSFSSSATDIVDGSMATTCAPVSGSTFALITTVVTCSASDAHGNTVSASFNVTVRDTTPPVVTVPANITVEATGATGAAVTFSSTASDIVDGSVATTCTPASVSTFALGTTTVTCTATDGAGNSTSSRFTVTTLMEPPQSTGGPRVTDLRLPTNGRRVTAVVLAFDKELNRAGAERLSNYQLLSPGKDRRFGTRDDRVLAVRSASYDSAANTVTLTPVKRLKTNQAFRITVQDAVTDVAGNPLDGDANGQAGGDFIGNGGAWTRIAYTDADGDRVVLRLDLTASAADRLDADVDAALVGLMEVTWGPTITGRRLHLVDTVAGESELRGSVQPGPGGDGQTVLESITGLAGVRNRLPSSFVIGALASVVDEVLERDLSTEV